MNFKGITSNLTRLAGRTGLVAKKHSPEILMITGVLGIVTSTVLACRATLKAEDVIEEANAKIAKIHEAKEMVEEKAKSGEVHVVYTDQDYKKDLAITYVQTGWDFIKLYGPSFTLGAASIACILGAHGIMRKRNLALVAAYKAVEQSFADYRKRVVEEYGADKDRQFKYGIREEKIMVTEKNAKGKDVQVEKTIEVVDPNHISQYARYFDSSSVHWDPIPEYALMFLRTQQSQATDQLNTNGHLFLNEVYDMLGIPRTQAGSVVGWVKGKGDQFVDFGIYETKHNGYESDHDCDTIGEKRRDFVNGHKNGILLDFNVAGVIYDLI